MEINKQDIEKEREIIKELQQQLAEKDKEINKLKKPKKYVYNCLSFVSNSDATDVAKYIEDLHQTIAQNNEELDEYIKKIVKLKERIEDKDEEIVTLKEQLAEKDKQIRELLKKEFETFGDMKDYKNLWLAEQENAKEIRKQVCNEVRNVIDYYEEWYEQGYVINMLEEDLLKEIDKIERTKGEKDE